MDKRQLFQWIAICVALVVGAFGLVRVTQLGSLNGELQNTASQATRDVGKARDAAIEDVRGKAVRELASSTETAVNQQLQIFDNRLSELTEKVEKRREELSRLEKERDLVSKGLPGAVNFDELGQYYEKILAKDFQYNVPAERFSTAAGEIDFAKRNIQIVRLLSNGSTVLIKIGKDDSLENAELIRAWIAEAERAKTKLGYSREYRRVRPADYGQVTESLFKKGDFYFKTFLQYQRIQGTYGRHSLQYTYFVETGSISRKERYELEQYNRKLGS